jgi:hypothetical protein
MQTLNDLKIVYVPVSELHLADYNPRKHSPEAMSSLKESLKRFGTIDPVIVENEVSTREYAKYVLKEGTPIEKRELLGNLRSRLVYTDKKIELVTE